MALCLATHEPSPHNLVKNKCLLINVAFLAPRLKARIRRSCSGTFWVGTTYPLSRRLSGSPDRKAQKPAAPSFAGEIHLSTEITCCFWPWPHSFLRCFRPARSRILSCDRTIPLMYVRTPRNLRGGYSSWPTETALGTFECRRERRSVRETARLARRLSASACHCFFIHVVVRERASIVCHGNMFFFGPSKPNARESFEFLPVGAEPCAPGLPIPAQNRCPHAIRCCLLNASEFSRATGL